MVISVTTGKRGNIKNGWLKQFYWRGFQLYIRRCMEAIILFSFTTDDCDRKRLKTIRKCIAVAIVLLQAHIYFSEKFLSDGPKTDLAWQLDL